MLSAALDYAARGGASIGNDYPNASATTIAPRPGRQFLL
jgi:hypothetical protein